MKFIEHRVLMQKQLRTMINVDGAQMPILHLVNLVAERSSINNNNCGNNNTTTGTTAATTTPTT